MMNKCINIVLIFLFLPAFTFAQPEKGFVEVFSNNLLLGNILQHLKCRDISSLRSAMSGNPFLAFSERLIFDLSLYVIEDIDERVWKDRAYRACMGNEGAWTFRGTPQPGMREYSKKREFSVARVVSHKKNEFYGCDWNLFGELTDGTVFHMEATDGVSSFGYDGWGVVTYAPNWSDLISNLKFSDFCDLISNLQTTDEFMALLIENMGNLDKIKKLLGKAFSKRWKLYTLR